MYLIMTGCSDRRKLSASIMRTGHHLCSWLGLLQIMSRVSQRDRVAASHTELEWHSAERIPPPQPNSPL